MAKFKDLVSATDIFFSKHWPASIGIKPYTWMNNWSWNSSVPYHDKSGVYALMDEHGEVVYIGLGASRGSDIYREHGISRRLLAHVIITDNEKGNGSYKPRDNWKEVVDIAAIGFPSDYSYLAPALEDYLIREFNPSRNSLKTTK